MHVCETNVGRYKFLDLYRKDHVNCLIVCTLFIRINKWERRKETANYTKITQKRNPKKETAAFF